MQFFSYMKHVIAGNEHTCTRVFHWPWVSSCILIPCSSLHTDPIPDMPFNLWTSINFSFNWKSTNHQYVIAGSQITYPLPFSGNLICLECILKKFVRHESGGLIPGCFCEASPIASLRCMFGKKVDESSFFFGSPATMSTGARFPGIFAAALLEIDWGGLLLPLLLLL